MGIRNIDVNLCNSCGLCARNCPMDVIRMGSDKKAHIHYLSDCQSCMLCEKLCPKNAIYVYPVFERRIPLPW